MANTKKTEAKPSIIKKNVKNLSIDVKKCENNSDIKKYVAELKEKISNLDEDEADYINKSVEGHISIIDNNNNSFLHRRAHLYTAIGIYNYIIN